LKPDEYLELPVFWKEWGIIGEAAESMAEKEMHRNATNKSKNKQKQ